MAQGLPCWKTELSCINPKTLDLEAVRHCAGGGGHKHMSRGLLALVPIFAGCSSPFLDSLSVLLHEVTLELQSVAAPNQAQRQLWYHEA